MLQFITTFPNAVMALNICSCAVIQWRCMVCACDTYLEHVGEQEQESRMHACPQANRRQDAKANPPYNILCVLL